MLTIACVNHGDYLGMGDRYVAILRAMVARHLRRAYEFVCLENVGALTGWWSKIALFEPGRFTGRVAYFDLDSVIVGSLERLVDTKGIVDLADWGWPDHTLCSSCMVWDAGDHDDVFTRFTADVPRRLRGDQDWITEVGGWPVLPAHLCRSYRYVSVKSPPPFASVVQFHGKPKPHEITSGWVPEAWRQ